PVNDAPFDQVGVLHLLGHGHQIVQHELLVPDAPRQILDLIGAPAQSRQVVLAVEDHAYLNVLRHAPAPAVVADGVPQVREAVLVRHIPVTLDVAVHRLQPAGFGPDGDVQVARVDNV